MSQFDESKIRRGDDGKFAEKPPAPESSVALAEATDWEAETGMEAEELLAAARQSASYFARRYQVDEDELASEAVTEYLHQIASGKGRVSTRSEKHSASAHIRTITKGLAQRIASGHKHGGPNLTAVGMYLKQREEYESVKGESMSSEQEDALATKIRDEWKGSRKPDIGFHRARSLNRGTASLDEMRENFEGDESSKVFDSHASTEEVYFSGDSEFEEGSIGREVDDLASSSSNSAKAQARRQLWSVLASTTNAPQVEPESLTNAEATAMRSQLSGPTKDDAGNKLSPRTARELVDKFDRGELTEEESEALFSPWGGNKVRGDDQERIVDALTTSREMTNDIWDAAVYTMTRSRKK